MHFVDGCLGTENCIACIDEPNAALDWSCLHGVPLPLELACDVSVLPGLFLRYLVCSEGKLYYWGLYQLNLRWIMCQSSMVITTSKCKA